MCLIIRYFPKVKIATQDITVYKCIMKNGDGVLYLLTSVTGKLLVWTPGTHYKEMPDIDGNVFWIRKNFTSWEISKGLHSFKTYQSAEDSLFMSCDDSVMIVKMIIPKGTKYYESLSEYVSDELIYPSEETPEINVIDIISPDAAFNC